MSEESPVPAQTRPKLVLIDGFHNIFRAFYAIKSLSNSKGVPTNAVYGFVQTLRKIVRDEKPMPQMLRLRAVKGRARCMVYR